MPSHRERVVAAAIELLGTEGVRALTHRRVDERAGLPSGSTSNYFRTRASLLQGVVAGMVTDEVPAVRDSVVAATPGELVDHLVELFEFLTGPNRVMTAARMALFLEAGHDDVLRDALGRGRAVFGEQISGAFAALGAPDPALATDLLAVCFEGMFLHRIARHAEIDVRAILTTVVHSLL